MSDRVLATLGEGRSFPSVKMLETAKKLALRRRVWFKLSRVERGIVDLTVKCVDCIKSRKLAKVVVAIMSKLESAFESMLDRLVRTIGLALAQNTSSIAVRWGNRFAFSWAEDNTFARFLVVNLGKM